MEEKIKILWECQKTLWECKQKQCNIIDLQQNLWKNIDVMLAEVKSKENTYWSDMLEKIKTIQNYNII